MATETTAVPPTTQLRLASGNGPITRTILRTPLRDATDSEIPLIDISAIFSASLSDRQAVAKQVRDAATNMGFFYIKNHGVPADITKDAYVTCLAFFRQDMDIKMKADTNLAKFGNGYRAPDTQRINPDEGVDVREAFSYRYDPKDDPTVTDLEAIPEDVREQLRCEDFPWEGTENMPRFRESALRYFRECLKLARALTRCFALSLGLEEGCFDEKVRYPDAAYTMNYYPPIAHPKSPSDASARVSIGSHTDFQIFTILWQDDVGGLQVLNREGQWLNAKPVEGTFVVNIGDCLQRITNDVYVSTVHRAQNWSGKERVSMPFFWGFGLHEMCSVVESCVGQGEGGKKKYEDVRCADWVARRLAHMLELDGEKGE